MSSRERERRADRAFMRMTERVETIAGRFLGVPLHTFSFWTMDLDVHNATVGYYRQARIQIEGFKRD